MRKTCTVCECSSRPSLMINNKNVNAMHAVVMLCVTCDVRYQLLYHCRVSQTIYNRSNFCRKVRADIHESDSRCPRRP